MARNCVDHFLCSARLHHYYRAGYLHFITTSCYQRQPLLGSPPNRDPFLRVLEQVRRRYRILAHVRRGWTSEYISKILLTVVVAGPVCAQETQLPGTAGREPATLLAQAVRVEHAPRMDGTLNDPLWQRAAPIKDFRQREPYEGQPATEKTEVRVLYTRTEIYFGIACQDSQVANIVATQLRRDVTQELDDYFEILIDSRRDRRNAYVFQINPLGTQRDALITDEQAGETQDGDPGWDGVWTSVARIDGDGWTATVVIPFSTLNFMRSHDVVWGVNYKRFIRQKNEEDLWSGWRRTFGANKISEAGELRGITDIRSGRLFIVKPYALGGFNHLPESVAGTGLTPGMSALHTGGVDIKVGLRSNLVANLTGNTDFADSDVDVQQFNLTPYKLFFPEKRQFFWRTRVCLSSQ